MSEPCQPSPLDDFMFDLTGYLILRNALEAPLLDRLNQVIDELPPIEVGQWLGNAHRRDYTKETGLEIHNCIELGGPFETLIDHPSWIQYVRHYCGDEQSYTQGLFIDESVMSVRGPSGHHPAHSGGFRVSTRGTYRYLHNVFRCGQCNILMALTDVGPGDGPTMVIPGSHKSNFQHPNIGNYGKGDRMDSLEGAVEVYLNKGDALLFVDGLIHGGSSRKNPGERRVVIYRYGVSWGASRYNYEYSEALLQRLTPERRQILQPVAPLRPPRP